MSQTTVQKSEAIRLGSVKAEVAATIAGPWTNLGALRDAHAQETWEKVTVESDNAGDVKEYIKNQQIKITALLLEYDLEILDALRGDIDEYSTTAGSLVSGATQAVASGSWGYNDPIVVENQNGDGSALTINSVTGSVDGALVSGTDYFVGEDENGDTVVTVIDTATVTTESQTITIDYDYTPNASKNITTGGNKTMSNFAAKLTNANEDGENWIIQIYKCSIDDGLDLSFQSDEADDVNGVKIAFTGILDVSRSIGDQLYAITDEQSTT